MESILLTIIAVIAIGALLALNILQFRERRGLLDRIQSGGLAEYKAQERKGRRQEPEKKPEPPVFIV